MWAEHGSNWTMGWAAFEHALDAGNGSRNVVFLPVMDSGMI